MTDIDNARSFLVRRMKIEYRDYITNELAGDFACDIASEIQSCERVISACFKAIYAADAVLPYDGSLCDIARSNIEKAIAIFENERVQK